MQVTLKLKEVSDDLGLLRKMIGTSWQNLYCIVVTDNECLIEAMLGEQAEREFDYWVMDQSSVYINEWSQPKGRKHWSVLHGTLTEI